MQTSVLNSSVLTVPPGQSSKPGARFAFIDGLRGLAALSIVVFHIWWYEPWPYPVLDAAPLIDIALMKIRAGVQILLVISGFVIAFTLRHTWVRPAEVYSFIIRRLVRLVPCYWLTIAAVILVDLMCRELFDLSRPMQGSISMARVWAHMAFLQDIFGHEALSAGVWTLCIEMQFYFVAILGWGLAQHLFPRADENDPRPSESGLLLAFGPIALISLFYWRTLPSTDPWVIHFIWMFFLGMSTWWVLEQTISPKAFAAIVAIGMLELVMNDEWRHENAVALTTALIIFAAGRLDRMQTWLNWSWLQFLGRISYSLYLIHFPVCHLITTAGWKWYGDSPTALQGGLILAASLGASVIAGQILYVFVEAPSGRLAARLKQGNTLGRPIHVVTRSIASGINHPITEATLVHENSMR